MSWLEEAAQEGHEPEIKPQEIPTQESVEEQMVRHNQERARQQNK